MLLVPRHGQTAVLMMLMCVCLASDIFKTVLISENLTFLLKQGVVFNIDAYEVAVFLYYLKLLKILTVLI